MRETNQTEKPLKKILKKNQKNNKNDNVNCNQMQVSHILININ